MLTLTLSTLGLPLAGVGLLLAIEPIIDMGRTAVNVTGQSLAATVVAKRAGILDQDVWDSAEKGGFDLDSDEVAGQDSDEAGIEDIEDAETGAAVSASATVR
jgi:hypothetical protein